MKPIGVIMDLDGTLIDTPLDFEHIRKKLGLASGAPILEAISEKSETDQVALHKILLDLEMEAASLSQEIAGASSFFQALPGLGLKRAIFTRNARSVAEHALNKHQLMPEILVAREDAPPKPDPSGLRRIMKEWACESECLIFLGDYLYDIEAGKSAGIRTLLFAPKEIPPFADRADGVYRNYEEALNHLNHWLRSFTCL